MCGLRKTYGSHGRPVSYNKLIFVMPAVNRQV